MPHLSALKVKKDTAGICKGGFWIFLRVADFGAHNIVDRRGPLKSFGAPWNFVELLGSYGGSPRPLKTLKIAVFRFFQLFFSKFLDKNIYDH